MIKQILHDNKCKKALLTLFTEIQGYSTFVDSSNTTNRRSTNDGDTEHELAPKGDTSDTNSNSDDKPPPRQNIGPDALR